MLDWSGLTYLNHKSTTVKCESGRELTIFGSPWTPRHGNWAFQYAPDENIWKDTIPEDTDILVTHGPPKAHLDRGGLSCDFLLQEIWRVPPKLHVFGHIHAGYGREWVQYDALQRAYEVVVSTKGGFFNLLRVCSELFTNLLRGPREARGQLVNAATVGGFRDELRRPPISVTI